MIAKTLSEGREAVSSARGRRRPSAKLRRSMARLVAIQALFQVWFNQRNAFPSASDFLPSDFLPSDFLDEEEDGLSFREMDQVLFRELVEGNQKEEELLNNMVSSVLNQNWALDRLDPLLLVIMKAGAYEIQVHRDVPVKVLIAEYVDIAHAYFGDKETAMVNGVLDKLAHSSRADEFKGQ